MHMCTCMCVIVLLSSSKSRLLLNESLFLFLKQLVKKRISTVFFSNLKFSCNLCMHRNVLLELFHNRNNQSLHIRLQVSQTGPAMSCLPQPILISLWVFFLGTKHRCEKWGHAALTVRPVTALGVAPTIYCSYALLSFLGHHPDRFYMWVFFSPLDMCLDHMQSAEQSWSHISSQGVQSVQTRRSTPFGKTSSHFTTCCTGHCKIL